METDAPSAPAPLQPSPRDERRTLWQSAARYGVLIGLLFAVVQFAISEGAYQAGLAIDQNGSVSSEWLYTISDTVSFPAIWIYEEVENQNIRAKLEGIIAGEVALPSPPKTDITIEKARVVLEKFNGLGSPGFEEDGGARTFLNSADITYEVPTWLEYTIYGGVCLAWGLIVGVAAYIWIGMRLERMQYQRNRLGIDPNLWPEEQI